MKKYKIAYSSTNILDYIRYNQIEHKFYQEGKYIYVWLMDDQDLFELGMKYFTWLRLMQRA